MGEIELSKSVFKKLAVGGLVTYSQCRENPLREEREKKREVGDPVGGRLLLFNTKSHYSVWNLKKGQTFQNCQSGGRSGDLQESVKNREVSF